MTEHEELRDEDVIVVIENEEGEEQYYREEMIIPIGEDRFAVRVLRRVMRRRSQRSLQTKTARTSIPTRAMRNSMRFDAHMSFSKRETEKIQPAVIKRG